ncbi:MAG TPA: M20/M25/M40 family metallo-hydrolase [Candidatus Saccharimonadales bacterium]|nr:M20/M25/M40 family metallo-hydrolase [Candidatus Saccharimonadales bacterium]
MINEIVSLSKILIAVSTVIGDQKNLDLALEIVHQDLSDFKYQPFHSHGYNSILYYNTESYTSPFKIILNGQLDVAYAKDTQFTPYIKEGKLYGRGAYDMKGAAAVMVLLYKELANKVDYPLALQLTTDQELDSYYGTRYQIEQGVRAEFVVNTSTTKLNISNESKGNMRLKITALGKRSASAYIWEGQNAIWKMKKFLDVLEKDFSPPTEERWMTTVNIGQLTTTNKDVTTVPEDCEVYLDIKFVKEDQESILEKIKQLIPQDFTLEVLVNEPPHYTPKDNPYIQLFAQAAEQVIQKPAIVVPRYFIGSLRHYNAVGGHGASFGPIGGNMHADNEWVDIQSLADYYKILKKFLLSVK